MKNIFISFFIFLFSFFIFSENLPADEPKQFLQRREDGSELKGYLSVPPGYESFPIAILCQGSYSEKSSTQSVYDFHQIIASFFNSVGIGVLSIEKKGVDREHFDASTFHEYNLIENRMSDYKQALEYLSKSKPRGWDSSLIFIGTSEGGWIAPRLAQITPHTEAVLIFGGAGAWKFKEEITLLLKKNGSPLSDKELELQFKMMEEDPSPQKFWLGQTYRFWACSGDLSNRDDILNLTCPIYLSIGSEDDCIESSDDLWKLVQEKKKTNITYARYEGLTHNMLDKRYTVFQDAAKWSEAVIAARLQY